MKHIYACLAGQWVNLSEDPGCKVGTNFSSPSIWFEEEGPQMFEYDHVNIHYQGVDYRIHPSFIQVVSK